MSQPMKRPREYQYTRAHYANQPFKRPRVINSYVGTYPPRNTVVVPGVTRIGGAYKRALPRSGEKKYLDTAIASSTNIQAGVIYPSLNLVPQGTTDSTRIGNKITITNINLHLYPNNDSYGGPGGFSGGNIRYIVYLDKQCNGATATPSDILTNPNIQSFRNMNNLDRFQILYDKVTNIPIEAREATTDVTAFYVPISRKVNIPIYFSSIFGALTEIRSNNIGLLAITDTQTTNVGAIGLCRIKFTDD